MKHRCMEVANVDWIFGDVVAEVIGFAVADSTFDATNGRFDSAAGIDDFVASNSQRFLTWFA